MADAKNRVALKPKIVCVKKYMGWLPAVELPEELDPQDLTVLQNGWPLAPDEELKKNLWPLREPFGCIIVQLGGEERRVALGCTGCLLFRLRGDTNRGRLVAHPSLGWHIAFVADTWERDEALAGREPIVSETTYMPGYRAHYFFFEKTSEKKIAFRTPAGNSFVLEPKRRSVQPVEPVEHSSDGDAREIRWALGKENEEPVEWTDEPLSIDRNDLAATSNQAVWVQLAGRHWTKNVFAGFKQEKARPYVIRSTKHTVAIPLRDFCDSDERDQPQKHLLQVWTTANDRYAPVAATVAILL